MDPRPHKNHLVEVVNTLDVLLTKLIVKKVTALDQMSIIMSAVIVVDTQPLGQEMMSSSDVLFLL